MPLRALLLLILLTVPLLAVDGGVRSCKDLEYARVGERSLRLDLCLPVKAAGPLPLVVYIHGGGWREGSKADCPLAAGAALGMAVASIEYRFSQEAPFPAQIHDCKAAIRWLRHHAPEYGIDGGRIGVCGASAGGHLAALLGTSGDVAGLEGEVGERGVSSRVQAVVDWFGPTDFVHWVGHHGAQELRDGTDLGRMVEQLFGGRQGMDPDHLLRASPVAYATKDDPPFLIMHGDRDTLVPIEQSRLLDAALRKAGVDVQLVELPDSGHGDGAFAQPVQIARILGFLMRHLHIPDRP